MDEWDTYLLLSVGKWNAAAPVLRLGEGNDMAVFGEGWLPPPPPPPPGCTSENKSIIECDDRRLLCWDCARRYDTSDGLRCLEEKVDIPAIKNHQNTVHSVSACDLVILSTYYLLKSIITCCFHLVIKSNSYMMLSTAKTQSYLNDRDGAWISRQCEVFMPWTAPGRKVKRLMVWDRWVRGIVDVSVLEVTL